MLGSRLIASRSLVATGCTSRPLLWQCTRSSSQYSLLKGEKYWSERILPALQVFRQVKKHCNVDQRFVVPAEAPWPKEAYGLRLGVIVHNMRSGQYATHVKRDWDRLVELEFAWNAFEARWKEMIMPALEVYVRVYKKSRVPAGFIVPCEAPWPERAWNLKLGYIMRDLRSKGCYADQVKQDADKLREIGVLDHIIKKPMKATASSS